MPQEFDFDRYWLEKFSQCLEENAGVEVRSAVMQGSELLSINSNRQEVAEWTKTAMGELSTLVDEEKLKTILRDY